MSTADTSASPEDRRIYLAASSCHDPLLTRHWVELDAARPTSIVLATIRSCASMCKHRGFESLSIRLPQGFRWGPNPQENVPTLCPDTAILEVVCCAGETNFRIRGQGRDGLTLCQTALHNTSNFVDQVVYHNRQYFPGINRTVQELVESVRCPDKPYGDIPGHFECRRCGSSEVIADTNASWNTEDHRWIMADDIGSYFYCSACEETSAVEWVEDREPVESVQLTA